jgi:hypothetical protein
MPKPEPEPEPEPELASDPDLAAAGVTEAMVRMVFAVGVETGYSFDGGDPNETALLALIVCENVDMGETTWEGEYDDAILAGADPASAAFWNEYLELTFCPALL